MFNRIFSITWFLKKNQFYFLFKDGSANSTECRSHRAASAFHTSSSTANRADLSSTRSDLLRRFSRLNIQRAKRSDFCGPTRSTTSPRWSCRPWTDASRSSAPTSWNGEFRKTTIDVWSWLIFSTEMIRECFSPLKFSITVHLWTRKVLSNYLSERRKPKLANSYFFFHFS